MKRNITETPENRGSFGEFMMKRENKLQLLALLSVYVVVYILLVYLYPYPAGISDSGSYVRAASENMPDTYRPFGYSRFLIMIHGLNHSIHFLVFCQFLINAACTLFLLFTIKFLFPPRRRALFWLLSLFAVLSPLTLYLANSVLSDSAFTSLTMLWIGTGLWMIYCNREREKIALFIIHAIILFFLIKIRYTGLVYMAVSLLFILISFGRRKIWMPASLAVILLLMMFLIYRNQKSKTYELVHVSTFSGFSGWQKASNALNCFPYIRINPSNIRDRKVREFTKFAMQYDTLLIMKTRPSAKYMWDNRLPLKSYCFYEAQRTNTPYIYQWNLLGAQVYGKFGSYIIKKHPLAFTRYYLLPNCRLILYPVDDQVVKVFRTDWIPDDLLRSWFEFKDGEKLYSRSNIFRDLYSLIPLSRLALWILFIASLVIVMLRIRKAEWTAFQSRSAFMMFAFVAVYFAFSAYAGPFELRYSSPIHMAIISLIYISLNEFILNSGKGKVL